MGIYSKYVLPRVVHHVCGQKPAMKQRRKIIGKHKRTCILRILYSACPFITGT